MRRSCRVGIGLLALAIVASGCYGPFNLTRRLYQWNGEVGDKWEKELVFLLLIALPVYELTAFGDAIVFNSMEFWTGNNPVDPPTMRKGAAPQTKRLVRGTDEALLTYTSSPDGGALLIEQFRQGQPAGSLRLARRGGVSTASDAEGHVLFTATTASNGRVIVRDASGQQVALSPGD